MSLILWAIPVAAFLIAMAQLARRYHYSVANKLIREQTFGAKFFIVANTETPAPASPKRQVPGIPGPVCGVGNPAETADLARGSISRQIFEPLCRKFRIREMSLLPSQRRAGDRKDRNLQILVHFDLHARVDYPVFFRLRNELFMTLGRRVDLVCKNSAERERQREDFAQAHVLYAA